jgi:DNA-binding NtrC family response regulator
MRKYKILWGDKEQNNLNAYMACYRRREDFDTKFYSDYKKLLADLEHSKVDLIIIDHCMLNEIGLDYFKTYKTNVIVVTSSRTVELLEDAVKQSHISNFICKPFEIDVLNDVIESLLTPIT